MSTNLKGVEGRGTRQDLLLTKFSGGEISGQCLQITQNQGVKGHVVFESVQLDKTQALELIARLAEFVGGKSEEIE